MRQLSLFEQDNRTVTHIAGLTTMVKAAMNRAAAASAFSREQILDRMNHLAQVAGVRMTQGNAKAIKIDTLEKWLAPDSDATPSLLAVEIFMQAVGNVEPLAAWLSLHNCEVMSDEDRFYRDYGLAQVEREEAADKVRSVKSRLKEVRK